jgi:hypothetical protein
MIEENGTETGEARISDEQTLKGMTLIVMENQNIKLSMLPQKGADIYGFVIKALQTDLLWKSPFGLRDPAQYVPPGTDTFGNFIELYEGGWQDIFPNGGAPCRYKGANLGLNAEVCNLPWNYRILDPGPASVKILFETITYQTPFRLKKTVTLNGGEPWVTIDETITNEGMETMDYMWGQHVAFDGKTLRSGNWHLEIPCSSMETNATSIHEADKKAPGNRINRFPTNGVFQWPSALDVDGNKADVSRFPRKEVSCDILYLQNLDTGWFALVNEKQNLAFAMTWPLEVFPYVWCWRNFNGSYGYPWYGRANCVAIEPFTSYPALGLAEAVARGTQRTLTPGKSISTGMKAGVISPPNECSDIQTLLEDRGLLYENH